MIDAAAIKTHLCYRVCCRVPRLETSRMDQACENAALFVGQINSLGKLRNPISHGPYPRVGCLRVEALGLRRLSSANMRERACSYNGLLLRN